MEQATLSNDVLTATGQFSALNVQLAKYERSTTYLSRFSCSPGEPYYAMGPANFLTSVIKSLNAIIASGNFESDKQEQLALSLLEEYEEFNRLYRKSARLDVQ